MKRHGFTLVELLAVLAIMAVLIGILVPAVNMVRRIAKEAAQRAQLASIDMGLMAFRGDYGDYPPSDWGSDLAIPPNFDSSYTGAQRLAEALLGMDLLGFHPNSRWVSDGTDAIGTQLYPLNPSAADLNIRRGPYLELSTVNAFKLGDLYTGPSGTGTLAPNPFVLCDVFRVKKIDTGAGPIIKAGTPILYYRANTSSKTIDLSEPVNLRIYNAYDNSALVALPVMTDKTGLVTHPLHDDGNLERLYNLDYNGGIIDSRITTIRWPHRPDSYILISAGADGLYGTSDDIRNF